MSNSQSAFLEISPLQMMSLNCSAPETGFLLAKIVVLLFLAATILTLLHFPLFPKK